MVGILSLGCVTGVHLTFHARGIGSGPYLDVCVPRTAHTSCTHTQEKVQKTIPVGLSLPRLVFHLPLFSFPVTLSPQLKAIEGDKSFLPSLGFLWAPAPCGHFILGRKRKVTLLFLKYMLKMHVQLPLEFQ
jgi:hypothetical protein